MNAKEILIDARRPLAAGYWTKGTFERWEPHWGICYCAHGAIYSRIGVGCAGYLENYKNSSGAIRKLIDGVLNITDPSEVEKSHMALTEVGLTAAWNDSDEATLERVLAYYDEAIASLP